MSMKDIDYLYYTIMSKMSDLKCILNNDLKQKFFSGRSFTDKVEEQGAMLKVIEYPYYYE